MKCQILFSRKNKKNITNVSSAESAHSVVSVNNLIWKDLYFQFLQENEMIMIHYSR